MILPSPISILAPNYYHWKRLWLNWFEMGPRVWPSCVDVELWTTALSESCFHNVISPFVISTLIHVWVVEHLCQNHLGSTFKLQDLVVSPQNNHYWILKCVIHISWVYLSVNVMGQEKDWISLFNQHWVVLSYSKV